MTHKYAIIDVETTGGDPKKDKLTEIAIVLHDGNKVLDTYQTLINPERSIPSFITQITGINDDMVRYAPKFYEIAKEIIERTEDCYFVAHNARFDYGFITHEFRSLGYSYIKPTLCTVQLSRKAFPGLRSYSLSNLVKELDIPLNRHHRALDDALATAELFDKIMAKANHATDDFSKIDRKLSRTCKLPNALSRAFMDTIPNTTGVYYLHNEHGHILYIGKSIHIRQRIWQHFTDMSERGMKLQESIADVSWVETGNELASLLIENAQIKLHKPHFNKARRNVHHPLRLVHVPGQQRLFDLIKHTELQENHIQWMAFTDLRRAFSYLHALFKELLPLSQLDHLEWNRMHQWNQMNKTIHQYLDASPEIKSSIYKAYILPRVGYQLISLPGRHEEETFSVLANNGKALRYGFHENIHWEVDVSDWEQILDTENNCPEADKIVYAHLHTHSASTISKHSMANISI